MEKIADETDEQISIDTALVRFIDDNVADTTEVCVASTQSAKHDTRGAEQETRLGPRATFSTDGVTDGLGLGVDILKTFLRNTPGDTHGSDTTRLCDDDARAGPATMRNLVVKDELGQLCTEG